MPHTSTKGRTPAAAALTIALLACLGLAACGSSSSTTTRTTANAAATGTTTSGTTPGTTPSGTSSTHPVPPGRPSPARFAGLQACLAKKGITLPPRGAGGFLGGGPRLPKGVSRAQYAEALKACGANFPPDGHFRRVPHSFTSPRFHEVLVRFAACLRQNGIKVGEPNTSGNGPIFNTRGLNTGSRQFKAAEAKCRSTLFAGQRPKASPGTTGGGGGATG